MMFAEKLRTSPFAKDVILNEVLMIGATLSVTVTIVVFCLLFPWASIAVMVKLNTPPKVNTVVLLTLADVPERAYVANVKVPEMLWLQFANMSEVSSVMLAE